jgi:transcriptional regulator with XRE-family HTH domain
MEGELQKALGRNVRKIRESRGFSQEDFALEVGFHRTYIGAVERGERNLSLRSVERLAELLKTDAILLLRG